MKKITLIAALLALPSIASADDAAKAKLMEIGKANFAVCAACHGPEGKGVLIGAMKMGPTMEASKIVNGDPAIFALVLLNGIQKEGAEYMAQMAAMGATMDDEKLAGVMTYVRNSFGNTAGVVTVDEAKKYREQWKNMTGPVSRAKLAELAEKK
jgi:mono/diheme cytochrome c family protein